MSENCSFYLSSVHIFITPQHYPLLCLFNYSFLISVPHSTIHFYVSLIFPSLSECPQTSKQDMEEEDKENDKEELLSFLCHHLQKFASIQSWDPENKPPCDSFGTLYAYCHVLQSSFSTQYSKESARFVRGKRKLLWLQTWK